MPQEALPCLFAVVVWLQGRSFPAGGYPGGVGACEGANVGFFVGASDGMFVGKIVGDGVGLIDGLWVGLGVGSSVGVCVGAGVGVSVGRTPSRPRIGQCGRRAQKWSLP